MLAPASRIQPTRKRTGSRLASGLVPPAVLVTAVAAAALLCAVRANTAEEPRLTQPRFNQRPLDPGAGIQATARRGIRPSGVFPESPVPPRQTTDDKRKYLAPLPPETQYILGRTPYTPDNPPSVIGGRNRRPEDVRIDYAAYQGPSPDHTHRGFPDIHGTKIADSSDISVGIRLANQPAQPTAGATSRQDIPTNRMIQRSPTQDSSMPPVDTVTIPLAGTLPPGAVSVDQGSGLVTAVVRDTPLGDVLSALAIQRGLNLITSENITARVSVTLRQVPFEEALTQILAVAGYTWVRQGDILIVTDLASSANLAPHLQGREVRVFQLDYIAAADADLVIKGLLSTVGQSFLSESIETDNRRTRELVIVEDLPSYLARIDDYIRQIDVPPRQVLIEVHILSVELNDELKYGLNLEYLDKITPSLTLRTQGFADAAKFATGTSPAFFFNLAGGDLNVLLEALETTTDAKTLATPKVLALNGQEAKMQVGGRLGYKLLATTQTSTLESVEFLDVGVVLTVTPRIATDGSVLMQVRPEISTGEINPATGVPDTETTEVETSLMLPDGHGMLIGGLIQESDSDTQSKIPILGDLWLVGRLFQQDEQKRKRTEIIIALIPHVVPYGPQRQQRECEQFERATTPLVYGPLLQTPRFGEPKFPDAGRRMPLRYKTEHLRALPDSGAWVPNLAPQRCAPGCMPAISPDGARYEFIPPGAIPSEPPPNQWDVEMTPTRQPEFVN